MSITLSHFVVAYFSFSAGSTFVFMLSDESKNYVIGDWLLFIFSSPIFAIYGLARVAYDLFVDYLNLKFWVKTYLIDYLIFKKEIFASVNQLLNAHRLVIEKYNTNSLGHFMYRKNAKVYFEHNIQSVALYWWRHPNTDKEATKNKLYPHKSINELTNLEILEVYKKDIETNKYVWHKW